MSDYSVTERVPQTRPGDMAAMVPAYLAIWNAPENRRFVSFTGEPFTEEQARKWFSSHLAGGISYYTADEPKGGIAAIMILERARKPELGLGSLAVHPGHKYRGIGKQMVQVCLDIARAEGFTAVATQVFADNTPMLRLVIGFGFQPVQVERGRRFDGMDLVHLRRSL